MRKETKFGLFIVVFVLIGFTVIVVRQVKRIFPTETGALPVSVNTADNLEAPDPTDFSTITSTAATQSESLDEIPVGPTNNAISEEGWATREPLHNPPTEPLVLPEEEIDLNDMATAEATTASYGNQPDTMTIDTPVDPYAHTTEFPSAVDMNSPVSDSSVSSYYTDTASSEQLETASDIIPSRDSVSFEPDISHSSTEEYENVTPAQATFSDPIDLEPQNQTTNSAQRLFPTEGDQRVYEKTESSQTNIQSIQTPRQTSLNGQGPLQWIIKPGDSFWKIAEKHYGSGVYHQALAKWNASIVSSEQSLKPGTVIETPHKKRLRNRFPKLVPSQPERESSQTQPKNTSRAVNRQYVVRPGDTLFQIAKKTLGNGGLWNTIFKMNRDLLKHPDRLAPVMVLPVPHKAETSPPLNATVVPREASNKNRF